MKITAPEQDGDWVKHDTNEHTSFNEASSKAKIDVMLQSKQTNNQTHKQKQLFKQRKKLTSDYPLVLNR